MTPDVSIIVEWENVLHAGAQKSDAVLARLAEESNASPSRIEVLVCHDEDTPPSVPSPAAGSGPAWRTVRVPDSRYYEQKNHGAGKAAGGILVFLDSDAIPEPGWLEALLAPFADPAIEVVAGQTHIQADSVYSKAFALWWFFPLRAPTEPLQPTRHFFANNVAFRRTTFLAHPFIPIRGNSRGACLELAANLHLAGLTIWRASAARAAHPAPRGWRHFILRALAQGRDRLPRERGWRATVAGSAARLARHIGAGFVRTLRDRRHVAMPLAGVPPAMALCCAYYSLYFAGEVAALAGVNAVRRIRV